MRTNFYLVLISLSIATTITIAAPLKLKCWDVKATSSLQPLMTIDMPNEDIIQSVSFNYSSNSVYQYLPKSLNKNGNQSYYGSIISNSRSPYNGNKEYQLLPDNLRLILNKDLSEQGLQSANVDGHGKGHAAVLEIAQQMHRMWSGGSYYIRFRCTK